MCRSCKEGDYHAKGPSARSPHPWGEGGEMSWVGVVGGWGERGRLVGRGIEMGF